MKTEVTITNAKEGEETLCHRRFLHRCFQPPGISFPVKPWAQPILQECSLPAASRVAQNSWASGHLGSLPESPGNCCATLDGVPAALCLDMPICEMGQCPAVLFPQCIRGLVGRQCHLLFGTGRKLRGALFGESPVSTPWISSPLVRSSGLC